MSEPSLHESQKDGEDTESDNKYPCPESVQQFEALVWAEDMPCICEDCQPAMYDKKNCTQRSHTKFCLNEHLDVNKYGKIVFQPPDLRAHSKRKPEITHLAKTIIMYFDRPWEYMNDRQLQARENLLKWIGPRRTKRRAGMNEDTEQTTSGPEMRQLWKWLNELFSGDHIADSEFVWTASLGSSVVGSDCGLEGHHRRSTFKIRMHPNDTTEYGRYIALETLSTLIHEAVHIFLDRYGCFNCKTKRQHDGAGGHGRPFQMIAAKLEEVVPEMLGIPVDLGRWESFSLGWKAVARLPSRHDATDFRFSSTRLASTMDDDVGDFMRLTLTLVDFKPLQLLNHLSYKGAPLVNRHGFYIKIPDKEDGKSSKGDLVYHLGCLLEERKIDLDNMKPTASHFEMLPEAERLGKDPWQEERTDEDNEDWASCDEVSLVERSVWGQVGKEPEHGVN